MRDYRYFFSDRKVICVTHYKGKTIRGIAKCSPNDTFDIEKGKEIALLRCEKKLEEKRMKNIEERYNEICEEKRKIQKKFEKICKQMTQSNFTYSAVKADLEIMLEDLNN